MDLEFCRHIRVDSNEELFLRLIERTKSNPEEIPWPTVQVTVGSQTYLGSPVKVEIVRGESWLVLFKASREEDALSIVPIRSISGISLLNPQKFKKEICEPGPWMMDGEDVPSRSEIQRMLNSILELLSPFPSAPQIQLQWDTLESQPTSRILAAKVLKSLQELLPKLLKDSAGREAAQGIQTWELRFQPDAAIKVRRQEALLQIDFGFRANMVRFEESLAFEVEKSL